jgi:hypothetical protein
MSEYGALVENGSCGKAEVFGENLIEYRNCQPQIPHGLSFDLNVVCAEATLLSYSTERDKNLYFEKPQILLFRITLKCFNARILHHLPSIEDLRNPFCIQSQQCVNFVSINLNFIISSNRKCSSVA